MLSARISASDANEYPKMNPQIKQLLNPDSSIDELKKREENSFRKYDALWRENVEIQEKDLCNLLYAAVGNTDYEDWACNARGDIIVFIEDVGRYKARKKKICFHVFRKKGDVFKRIGTYSFVSIFLIPRPKNFLIEDDGITFVTSWSNVKMMHKFSFSSAKEEFEICGDYAEEDVLLGKSVQEKEIKLLYDLALPL